VAEHMGLMHLMGHRVPTGTTYAACGEAVLTGQWSWFIPDVDCDGCLDAPIREAALTALIPDDGYQADDF